MAPPTPWPRNGAEAVEADEREGKGQGLDPGVRVRPMRGGEGGLQWAEEGRGQVLLGKIRGHGVAGGRTTRVDCTPTQYQPYDDQRVRLFLGAVSLILFGLLGLLIEDVQNSHRKLI